MYSPEIREPRQRKRQTAAISPTYGDDDQSGQDKSPCSTHLHSRKTNFTFVYFQNVRLLLDGAFQRGGDEADEERVRRGRARLELGVELAGDEVRMLRLRKLDDLHKPAVWREAAYP